VTRTVCGATSGYCATGKAEYATRPAKNDHGGDNRAEMRRALGVAVFSGMLGVTLFGIFLTPVFYDVLRRLDERRARRA